MANKRKSNAFIDTDAFINNVANRAKFSKSDVKDILTSMQEEFEECIKSGCDIDLRGFMHLSVTEITYTKPTGIVKYHNNKVFNNKSKRIYIKPALNLTDLLRPEGKKKIKKTKSEE